jgi:hypothetical protein
MHTFKVLHSVIDLAGATEGLKQVLSGAAHDLGEAAQVASLGVGTRPASPTPPAVTDGPWLG